MKQIDACLFDAYGTLFNVDAAANKCKDILGDEAVNLNKLWRTKQLEYTWLRSLMDEYVDFWQITVDGLDYALETMGLNLEISLREKLLDLYMKLDCYPEVSNILDALKKRGIKCAILSNGSPKMLNSAIENGGIRDQIDCYFSVDELGTYKPASKVYKFAADGLGLLSENICFLSSNAWDASAAANFGFRVIWINRFKQKKELLPGKIEFEIETLADLPSLLG